MNNSVHSKNNVTRQARIQHKIDAGFVAAHFPDVANIVVSMIYSQKGIAKSLVRTLNFFPDSCASFRVDCLSKDCTDGGFDLTHVITGMIGNRREAAKGELNCEGNGASAGHSAIVYEVSIRYS